MIRLHRMQRRANRVRHAARWLPVLVLTAFVAACGLLDKGLTVTAPDRVVTSDLEVPANAALLVGGAVGNFECAFKDYIVAGGLMSGELMDATETAARWDFDKRNVQPQTTLYSEAGCGSLGIYTPISTARYTADNILHLLQGWSDDSVPGRTGLIAKAATYAGYSRILLGEAFCSAAIDGSAELSSNDIFAQAVAKFDTAIAAATTAGSSDILNMALVGRARAELDEGDLAAAAADAAQVPAGFVANATSDLSQGYRQNFVVSENNNGHSVSFPPAYRNVTDVNSAGDTIADPRVPVVPALDTSGKVRLAGDGSTPLYLQQKYADATSPIPEASYTEAQLILAEAQGGAQAVSIINTLRATAGLGAYPGPTATADDIKAMIAQERARWLFLEGQHLYDLRRLNIAPLPAAGTPYSIVFAKGGQYGNQVCFPLPDVERLNNPNLH